MEEVNVRKSAPKQPIDFIPETRVSRQPAKPMNSQKRRASSSSVIPIHWNWTEIYPDLESVNLKKPHTMAFRRKEVTQKIFIDNINNILKLMFHFIGLNFDCNKKELINDMI